VKDTRRVYIHMQQARLDVLGTKNRKIYVYIYIYPEAITVLPSLFRIVKQNSCTTRPSSHRQVEKKTSTKKKKSNAFEGIAGIPSKFARKGYRPEHYNRNAAEM
jgi:hypothetical protein